MTEGFPSAVTVLLTACVALACTGFGLRVLEWLRVRDRLSPPAALVHGLLLGIGAWSSVVEALAFAHLLRTPSSAWIAGVLRPGVVEVGAPLAAMGIAGALPLARTLQGLRVLLGRPRLLEPEIAVTVAVLILLTPLALAISLVPPTNFDTLVYHLGLPGLYAVRGGIVETPWFHYGSFPLQPQMAYLGGLLLGGTPLSGGISWLMGLAALGGAALLARWATGPAGAGRGSGPLAAALWLACLPTFLFAWTLSLADAFLTAALLLAFHALLLYRENGRLPLAALGGLHLGLALGAKYTAIPLGAILFALALFHGGRPRTWKPWLGFVLAAGIGAALFVPWAVRNAAWTGNPLYPFARSIFPGGAMTDEEAARNAIETGQVATSRTFFRDLAIVPWRLLTNPEPYGHLAGFGPSLLLAAAAGLAASFRSNPRARVLAYAMWGFYGYWFLFARNGRFLLPALGCGAALAGEACAALRGASRQRGAVALGALVAASLVGLFVYHGMQHRYFRPGGHLLGHESRDAYLENRFGPARAYRWASYWLPADARVLLVGETRGLYLDRDHVMSAALEKSPLTRYAERAALLPGGAEANLLPVLREAGITHVLVHETEAGRLDRDYDHFDSLRGRWKTAIGWIPGLRRIYHDPGPGVSLYELPPPAQTPSPTSDR